MTGLPRIAIIGLACRFPGASDEAELWDLLRTGTRGITDFSDDALVQAGMSRERLADPNLVKSGGVVPDIDLFDAAYFQLTPREAQRTDPQHRLFLECAVEALENAACDPARFDGNIGVFAGASAYVRYGPADHHRDPITGPIANGIDFLTTRVSYKLDLRGPSVVVQTACSTSLVAIHLACQSILAGESAIALAGGVSIDERQVLGYLYEQDSICSPDGHCRAFDASAQGTVPSGGVGIVVLKRLDHALRDGDPIRAIVCGTAINNDGANKIGFTAPSIAGQASVIAEAMAVADVVPRSITLVEAHGTGTPLGDPIEVAALAQAFAEQTADRGFCALGSIKSNIGHADAAAGVAGLIKAVLALEHREIPSTLDVRAPNPGIDFAASPFRLAVAHRAWDTDQLPRRAGVSSFGLGGTNAHAVLEEAPDPAATSAGAPWQLLVLSAKTAPALAAASDRLAAWLEANPRAALADVAFTLQAGRTRHAHRRAIVGRSSSEAARLLRDAAAGTRSVSERQHAPVAFLFPGHGKQHAGMARALYRVSAEFRSALDRCAGIARGVADLPLLEVLCAERDDASAAAAIDRPALAATAIVSVSYALAQMWIAAGVTPAVMLGHSLGEYVAACLAGVLTLEDAISLVAARGRLIERLPRGRMIAAALPVEDAQRFAHRDVAIAAINGPRSVVFSGPPSAIGALEDQLTARAIKHRALRAEHAYHSAMFDPILDAYHAEVQRVRLREPRIPYVSSLTGQWIHPEEATSPAYWLRQTRETVRCHDGLRAVLADPARILLDAGPGGALAALARQSPEARDATIAASLPAPHDPASELATVLHAAAQLWSSGAPLHPGGLCGGEVRRRLHLPTYPFERQRHWWTDAAPAGPAPAPEPAAASAAPSELESLLIKHWQEAFGVRAITPLDDFFALGGTSLLAIGILARVRETFPIEVSFADLFRTRTIRRLAEHIDQALVAKLTALPPFEESER